MNSAEQIANKLCNKGIIPPNEVPAVTTIISQALQEREQAIREPYLKLAAKWRDDSNESAVTFEYACRYSERGHCAYEIEGIK